MNLCQRETRERAIGTLVVAIGRDVGLAQAGLLDGPSERQLRALGAVDADAVLKAAEAPEIAAKREAYTKHAIEQGVFGAPLAKVHAT